MPSLEKYDFREKSFWKDSGSVELDFGIQIA